MEKLNIKQAEIFVWPLFAVAFLLTGKVHPDDVPNATDKLVKVFIDRFKDL